MTPIASHLDFVTTLIRAVSFGCAAFLLSMIVRTGVSWRRSRPDPDDAAYQLQRRQTTYMLAGITLLVAGILINHFLFVVRDESFHYGTILMVPGYLLLGIGMVHLNKFLHLRGESSDVDRPDEHQ